MGKSDANGEHASFLRHERGAHVQRKRAKPVRGHRKHSGEAWTRYGGGASEAARALGLRSGNISNCANQTRKSAGGYEFEFDDPTEPSVLPDEEWRDVL